VLERHNRSIGIELGNGSVKPKILLVIFLLFIVKSNMCVLYNWRGLLDFYH